MIVDLHGQLNAMFDKLHTASQQLINGAQNLRESKLMLDACLEGKSFDDAPEEIQAFHEAIIEMVPHMKFLVEMAGQFEASTDQIIAGAKGLK